MPYLETKPPAAKVCNPFMKRMKTHANPHATHSSPKEAITDPEATCLLLNELQRRNKL